MSDDVQNVDHKLSTINGFCADYPDFKRWSLDYLVFYRHEIGLTQAVVTFNGEMLIDEEKFFAWLDELNKY